VWEKIVLVQAHGGWIPERELSQLAAYRQLARAGRFNAGDNTRAAVWDKPRTGNDEQNSVSHPSLTRNARSAITPAAGGRSPGPLFMVPRISFRFLPAILLVAMFAWTSGAGTLRVATYNVETYLDQPTESRAHAKSAEARAKVRECIRAAHADLLALEEMGETNALLELRASLQAEGENFSYWEHVQAFDTNIHVAVLSKLPIVARRPHTNDFFLLDGRRFQVKRGFAEVDIQAATNFTVTLLVAHLKSRLITPEADEAEERLGEARVLRGLIDARLARDPGAKLIVLGDFNDHPDSAPLKEIIGRGKTKLFDTRPVEHNGDTARAEPPYYEPRDVAWTYFYGRTDSYERIDYLLITPALKPYWAPAETLIPFVPNWGIGSDHRPIVTAFSTNN
jgi:endonuclease/exonuclease/phosphatase family metal-dependent hydrolase